MSRKAFHDSFLWDRTDHLLDNFAAFEYHQGWDGTNAVIDGNVLALFCIYFSDDNLSVVFFCYFFDDRTDHAARSAPCRPKVDKTRLIRVQHFFIKRRVCDM